MTFVSHVISLLLSTEVRAILDSTKQAEVACNWHSQGDSGCSSARGQGRSHKPCQFMKIFLKKSDFKGIMFISNGNKSVDRLF